MIAAQLLLAVGDRRWATGTEAIDYGGQTYAAAGALEGPVVLPEDTWEPREASLSFTVAVVDVGLRSALLSAGGLGPEAVTVRIVYSTDHGATWTAINWRFRGQLGRSFLRAGRWVAEVVRPRRNALVFSAEWTHEDQQAAFPGDKALAGLAALAEGVPVSWPPS